MAEIITGIIIVLTMGVTIYWGRSLLLRIIQKGYRRAVLGLVLVLLGWQAARLLQLMDGDSASVLSRYLWYSYYTFRNLLTFCIFTMASVTDKPVDKDYMTGFEKLLLCFHVLLSAGIMLNDYHLQFTTALPDYMNTSYLGQLGWLYFFEFAVEYIEVYFSIGWMLLKAKRQQVFHKKMLVPAIVILGMGVYCLLFFFGWAPVVRTERVLVYTLGMLLFLETAVQSGLVGSNVRYEEFFSASDLGLEIFDAKGNMVYESQALSEVSENYELVTGNITDGSVHWHRDIKALRQKQRKLEQILQAKEHTYNALRAQELLKEEKVDYDLRMELYVELDNILASKRSLVKMYLQLLKNPDQLNLAAACLNRLNIVFCYLKKYCVLFLSGKNDGLVEAGDLFLALSETRKYVAYEELECLLQYGLKNKLPMEKALDIYYYYEEFLEAYSLNGGLDVVCSISEDSEKYEVNFLMDENEPWMELWLDYVKSNRKMSGEVIAKDLGYAYSLTLSLAKAEVKA